MYPLFSYIDIIGKMLNLAQASFHLVSLVYLCMKSVCTVASYYICVRSDGIINFSSRLNGNNCMIPLGGSYSNIMLTTQAHHACVHMWIICCRHSH